MVTNLTASQQIADLVKERHAAHPDETNAASWSAVQSDPGNADVFSRYAQQMLGQGVTASTPKPAVSSPDDGVAAVRQVGGALPRDHQQLAEDAPVDVRFAEAVRATMARCGLSGTAGREAATRLLADAEPELAAEYARALTVKL